MANKFSMGSISIRYNPNQEDDLDDNLFMDTGGKERIEFTMAKSESETDVTHTTPAAAPAAAPVPVSVEHNDRAGLYLPLQKDEQDKEKSSILSEIRTKLQDKMPEPLSAFIEKKFEDLSRESSPDGSKLKRNIPKSESLDFKACAKSDAGASVTPLTSPGAAGSGGKVRSSSTSSGAHLALTEEMDLVDDFFMPEAPRSIVGTSSTNLRRPEADPPASSRSSLESRLHSKFQKLMSHNKTEKASSSVPQEGAERAGKAELLDSTAVSLSGLLHRGGAEEEEADVYQECSPDPEEAGRDVTQPAAPPPDTPAAPQGRDVSVPDDVTLWVSRPRAAVLLGALAVLLVLPMPGFLRGLLLGAMVTGLCCWVYLWLTRPPRPREPLQLPPLEDLPPLRVPNMDSQVSDGKFKGWMNELRNYSEANFHISKTHSVYVTLEGSTLRLQRPKHNVPKRAMFDEQLASPTFVQQRYIDLQGAKVYLLPHGLVSKRLWSKKYPICIDPPPDSHRITDKVKVADDKFKSDSSERDLVALSADTRSLNGTDTSHCDEGEEAGNHGNEAADFEVVSEEQVAEGRLVYLFARTGREKEEWFGRLDAAAQGAPLPSAYHHLLSATCVPAHLVKRHSSYTLSEVRDSFKNRRQGSFESVRAAASMATTPSEPATPAQTPVQTPDEKLTPYESYLVEHLRYISKVVPNDQNTLTKDILKDKVNMEVLRHYTSQLTCEPQVAWVNALISRCLWDFLHEGYWKDKLMEKIQKKLSKIHVPYFIDELTVTSIELGHEVPVIRRATCPHLDERGLWVDLEVVYDGGFNINLETKVNLMKLKKDTAGVVTPDEDSQHSDVIDKKRSAVTDSDEEDSAESSTDDEADEVVTPDNVARIDYETGHESRSKKLLRLVDKITASKYFQQATENKFIKKAMQEVSNTRLMMTVSLRSLYGTMAVNIPPPPTDRIWYGFRTNPKLWLSAKPKVGQREVTVTHITEWIEKKLTVEFQRLLVMPNMDDLPVPLMIGQSVARPAGPAGRGGTPARTPATLHTAASDPSLSKHSSAGDVSRKTSAENLTENT